MSADRLQIEGLTKTFATPAGGMVTILDHLNCVSEPAETVAIVGPSGSGKSTLLNIIGSLEQPTAGRVTLGEIEVTSLTGAPLAEFRSQCVGFVFQDHLLLPQLTALENVLLPTLADDRAARAQGSAPTEERAAQLLELVGLSPRQHAFPAQLSGGERQRVAIARALINQPGLLLCDEPTGNLDRTTGAEVVSLLLDLAVQQGGTVVMVTHNLEQAARFGCCFELVGGKLSPQGGVQ
ncbi:MAG: ABC transporter ATP-binding protein [Bacteroidota bacterium]